VDAFRFLMPTEVVFGAGCFSQLGERCKVLGGTRPMLVTGKHSARRSGLLDRALAQLPGATLFEGVEENPSTTTCERGAAVCRREGCDLVVAIGGGSAMDAAKAIAVLARNPGGCDEYFGARDAALQALPIVAVPTTAGTGSEVTPYAVLVDSGPRRKRTISGRSLFPAVALLDPELTLGLPRDITINTGLDALSHAMEGMVSRKSTPIGDALALQACVLVSRWLPEAADDGANREARTGMLYASMLAGCVIAQSGTTLVHGMGYCFTLNFAIAHGLANGLLLAPVFQYNARYEPEKVATLAAALGHPAAPTPREAGARIGRAIHALFQKLGVSSAGREAGVDRARLRSLADDICGDPYRFRNQIGDSPQGKVLSFFECACEGTLLDD